MSMRFVLLLAVLVFALPVAAVAQEPLNVAPIPEGSLTRDQLQRVADDIRRLEANPLAPDVREARARLITWVVESPDVHVTLCGAVLEPLMDTETEGNGYLTVQHALSMAAYAITHEGTPDRVEANVAGLRGMLGTYAALREAWGERAVHPFLEELATTDDLAAYVRPRLVNCD
ncbi:MAG TPA: hypothetical protein VK610_09030 [Rhodothermales bacterium]|nr:hypothetical protein [Rhodothermales bacterium]